MADETLTTDYLGAQSPLALSERASLPIAGAFPSAGPVPSFGGKSAVGTGTPSATTQASTVTTTPEGAPGIPGTPAAPTIGGAPAPEGGGADIMGLVGQGEKLADILKRVFGQDFGVSLGADVPTDEKGQSIFGDAERGFTLLDKFKGVKDLEVKFDDQGRLILGSPDTGFTTLDAFREVPGFQDALGGQDIPSFGAGSFSGGEAAAYGIPANAEGGSGIGGAASLALPLAQFGFSLMQGGHENIGGALVKAAINFTPQAAGLLAGTDLADIGTATFNPVLSAWNLPQIASTIQNLVDPLTEQLQRRAGRNRDASELQSEILQPLINAKTPDEFINALATPVGGSTAGDALARLLKDNASGEWAGMAQRSFPDLGLIPLKNALTQLGYTGDTQPTRGDVGGVGEMMQSAGGQLIPQAVAEYMTGYLEPTATEGGAQRPTASPEVRAWLDRHMPGWGTLGGRAVQPGGGWTGWDATLQDLSRSLGLDTTAPDPAAPNPTAEFMSGGEGGGYWEGTATTPLANPAYLDALAASNPEAAENVRQALTDQAQRWADAASYQSA